MSYPVESALGFGVPDAPVSPGGMGSLHSNGADRNAWLTPRYLLIELGAFDLDPCSPIHRPWPTAANHYTIEDNGLSREWTGRVFLNPPYGNETGHWVRRLAEHGNGIALIFARTETSTFFPWVWDYCDAVFFLKGRVKFCFVNGMQSPTDANAPSMLIAYGKFNADMLKGCLLDGHFMQNQRRAA
jgi:hypothetical protein